MPPFMNVLVMVVKNLSGEETSMFVFQRIFTLSVKHYMSKNDYFCNIGLYKVPGYILWASSLQMGMHDETLSGGLADTL